MARKPRLHENGGVYHVMLRGNGGQGIFFDDDDRYHFYLLLQQGIARYGHRIHGFCLMSNHVHLAIQVGEEPLAKIMQNLSFRYTRWVNRKQKRIGHLFQGRYKAIMVDRDTYLLELVRYIHLNPVRAKLVRQPQAYAWSGHRAYIGQEALPWLTTDWVFSQFGARLTASRKRYEAFAHEGQGEGRRDDFHRGGDNDQRILGDDRFAERMLNKPCTPTRRITLDKLIKMVGHEYRLTESDLASAGRERQASEARCVIGWLAQKSGLVTLTEVGKRFGRDVTTLSRGVRQLGLKATISKTLAKRLVGFNNAIMGE
jgi:REP element-mobilizing transposase RayT